MGTIGSKASAEKRLREWLDNNPSIEVIGNITINTIVGPIKTDKKGEEHLYRISVDIIKGHFRVYGSGHVELVIGGVSGIY
jgi:hypothetical protein